MSDRYLVTLHVVVNNKKIEAIRELRGALGIGLVLAKSLVERPIGGYLDSMGGDLILNGAQVARLVALDHSCRNRSGLMHPTYTMTKVERINSDTAIDFSHINL